MTPPASRSFEPRLAFKYLGGDPALDLINTVDWTERGPENDRLTDYERLTRWGEGAGIISSTAGASLRARAGARPREAQAAYKAAVRARWVLWRILAATARGEPAPDALSQLNSMLARALPRLHLAAAGNRPGPAGALRLDWRELGTELESIIWPVLWSAASLLVSPDADRIRICGGADCGWMYVDRSRNGLRRWCQMETCGTREKSRRRYLRQRMATTRGSPRSSAPTPDRHRGPGARPRPGTAAAARPAARRTGRRSRSA
jgi:predicted RNA-binding Zn ribbon-like protein